MKKLNFIFLTMPLFLLAGCATTANYAAAVNSWQGATVSSLFKKWGYPNRILKLPNGNRLYVYRYVNRGQTPATVFPGYTTVDSYRGETYVSSVPPTIIGGESYDLRCVTWFEANRRNRIIGMSFRGNNCATTTTISQTYTNPTRLNIKKQH